MNGNNHEGIGVDGESPLSPGLQELADMADKFEQQSIKNKSTEELTRKLEKLDGYEVYGPELEERLKRDEELARINTLAMEDDPERNGSLILVCAKHPLIDGFRPGRAFSARLDEAILRYKMMKEEGQNALIRVPGSVHFGDKISLAEAGRNYLLEHGIPDDDISADGVEENGTDEITCAFSFFHQGGYKQFHICCGENQVFRNKMACMELHGILPYFHTCTTLDDMPHRIGFELGNPNGALRFLRVDAGVSIDETAKKRHTQEEDKFVKQYS